MNTPVIVHGTLKADGTLQLDQTPNLPAGPVVVTIQSAPAATRPRQGLAKIIDEIRKSQQARGFQGSSPEEIEELRQEGEAEYEKRMNSAGGS